VYETISVEERNKPAVGLIYRDFANDARSAASSRGMPLVRVVPEPIPSEWTDKTDIENGISGVIDDIVAALTRPLTAEERSPKPREAEKATRIVFKGNLREVNRFFYLRGWTDGLPIIPPTEEAVKEMLSGTDLPPDHIVALMPPRMGKATIEKIAINAVMAGALPTYLPVLIAGVQSQIDPKAGPTGMTVSTTSVAPLWIINGPLRRELNVNVSYGVLSPGDMANAAIGRAMGLITKNIRGVRKAVEDMGVLGNPGRQTMVVGENEEESPWEPLHIENGWGPDESTLTMAFSLSFAGLMPYGTDAEGILSTIVANILPENDGTLFIMLSPPVARVLSKAGWNKKTLKDYIFENARVPAVRHQKYWTAKNESPETLQSLDPNEPTPVLSRSERIPEPTLIFVAGGSGTRIGIYSGGPRPWISKKIELPAGWKKLVEKYRRVVPSHLRY
jgi:hypothetical protein